MFSVWVKMKEACSTLERCRCYSSCVDRNIDLAPLLFSFVEVKERDLYRNKKKITSYLKRFKNKFRKAKYKDSIWNCVGRTNEPQVNWESFQQHLHAWIHDFINTDHLPAPTKLTKQELQIWPKSYRYNANNLHFVCPEGHTTGTWVPVSFLPLWGQVLSAQTTLTCPAARPRHLGYDWQSTQGLLSSTSSTALDILQGVLCPRVARQKNSIKQTKT